MSRRDYEDAAEQAPHEQRPTAPLPSEPADVDTLLSESLKAQSERDFSWKEPERAPRWWERAEAQRQQDHSTEAATPSFSGQMAVSSDPHGQGIRLGSVVFALICMALAAWVVASVVFGLSVDPLMVGLVLSSVAGLALIAAGLRPKPGTRI